jgi:hypothetical protein
LLADELVELTETESTVDQPIPAFFSKLITILAPLIPDVGLKETLKYGELVAFHVVAVTSVS